MPRSMFVGRRINHTHSHNQPIYPLIMVGKKGNQPKFRWFNLQWRKCWPEEKGNTYRKEEVKNQSSYECKHTGTTTRTLAEMIRISLGELAWKSYAAFQAGETTSDTVYIGNDKKWYGNKRLIGSVTRRSCCINPRSVSIDSRREPNKQNARQLSRIRWASNQRFLEPWGKNEMMTRKKTHARFVKKKMSYLKGSGKISVCEFFKSFPPSSRDHVVGGWHCISLLSSGLDGSWFYFCISK